MKVPPENLPRYLPTLTEVVIPGQDYRAAPDTEAIIERVMKRLAPIIQIQLSEVIATLVKQEIREMEPRLLREVEQFTRQTVAQTVADEFALAQTR